MATFILASGLHYYIKDEAEKRYPIPLEDREGILTNIKKHVPKLDSIVYIGNNPANYERSDERGLCLFESFDMAGMKFKTKTILDNRTKKRAKKIIEKADLIILAGGKIICQMDFFKEIGLRELLENHEGLVIGTSAGAMNLCVDVLNFPEEADDMGQPLWAKGLGFYDVILIPHFDGETKTYQLPCEEVNVVNDYILPASVEKELIGQPDDSYILVDRDGVKFFGMHYIIKNKKVTKYFP